MLDNINWPFHYFFMTFFVAMGLVLLILDRKRRAGCRRVAQALGWEFSWNSTDTLDFLRNRFGFFEIGKLKQASTVFEGRWNKRPLLLFNYFFQNDIRSAQASGGDYRRGYWCGIYHLVDHYPTLKVVPISMLDDEGQGGGLEGFFDDKPFLARYKVVGKNGLKAQQLLCSGLRQQLCEGPDTLLEFGEAGLLVAQIGDLNAGNALQHADTMKQLLSHLPHQGLAPLSTS